MKTLTFSDAELQHIATALLVEQKRCQHISDYEYGKEREEWVDRAQACIGIRQKITDAMTGGTGDNAGTD